MSVRVYCPKCKGGNNAIWQGSLITWGVELSLGEPPEWYNYAERHEKAHPGHTIMVEYPYKIVPLFLSSRVKILDSEIMDKIRKQDSLFRARKR